MSTRPTAAETAAAQVASVRDDPAARLALLERTYHGPNGNARRQLPFRRAAMAFMRWQQRRGVLAPRAAPHPGSPWWRAVNERLLYDGCEVVALSGGLSGPTSSPSVDHWMSFVDRPTARNWYRAHNASVVAAYVEHRTLAEEEREPERFFLNVVLLRVIYAHALVTAPRLALGRFAPLGWLLGDPRLGMTSAFLSLGRVLPDAYPLDGRLETYLDAENGFGRMLDYAVIAPRLQQLYAWAADELDQPRLLDMIRDGSPTYAWSYDRRDVWRRPRQPLAARALGRLTTSR